MTRAIRDEDSHPDEAGTAWAALFAEFDAWKAAGRVATLWWRDDDADSATPTLLRLLALQQACGVPLALAVVPRKLNASLAGALAGRSDIAVLQHGYSHDNFAGAGDRKMELDGSRPAGYVIADLAMGQQILSALPGWLPVMVPPWNRIGAHLMPMLPELGYCGLSTLGPRARRLPVARLMRNNVHLDPIDWRGRFGPAGGFVGDTAALDTLTAHLRDRREDRADAGEASGLMTHHKVQDEAVWAFTRRLIADTAAHPAVRWCAAEELFAP